MDKSNKKIESYKSLLDKGVELVAETNSVINMYDRGSRPSDIFVEVDIVNKYHEWKNAVWQFLELSCKDVIEASFFKEIDSVPTADYLIENEYVDVFKDPFFTKLVLTETKKKLERLREIARQNLKKEQLMQISEFDKSKTPMTSIDKKDELGYLIFHKQRILIGDIKSGKFKLIEILCNESFGKAKTIDLVFETIKQKKDKNKIDSSLSSGYLEPNRKLKLVKDQVREINRAIKNHIRLKSIKNFKFYLSLKDENKYMVWLEEKVGRRG